MHDERIRPGEAETQTDQAILGLLLADTAPIWSVDEVVQAIGDRLTAVDGLNRLARDGLIHRLDDGDFVFAARAAARATDLALA